MRRQRTERRPSVLQRLFAERQVYLRSGSESRYVVISRSLQMGVTLVALLALAGLAFASYSSIVNHLEAAERSRELARLEGVNKSLLAAAEAVRSSEDLRAAAEQLPELTIRVEEAEAAREQAERLAQARSDETAELQRELDLAVQRAEEAFARVAALEAERESLVSQLNQAVAPAAGQPREEPEDAALEAEIADLTAERAALQAEVDQLRGDAESARAAVDELQAALEAAQAEEGDEAAALEDRMAELQAENERLGVALSDLRAQRQDLATRLEEADAAAGEEAAEDSAEADQLRQELEQAQQRIAELEQASAQAEAEAQRLEEQLANRIQAEQAPTPAAGPDNGASGPALRTASDTIAALQAELAAASELVAAVSDRGADGGASEELASLQTQIENAGSRIDQLSASLEQIRTGEAGVGAGSARLAPLAPLPPPPAPRG